MKYYTTNSHPKLKHGCEIQLNGNMELPYILDIGIKTRLDEKIIKQWLSKGWIIDNDYSGISGIRKKVCQVIGIEEEDINADSRKREIVRARQFIQWAANYLISTSKTDIGKFTNRDHSTVIYSRSVVENLNKTDGEYYDYYLTLKKIFQI